MQRFDLTIDTSGEAFKTDPAGLVQRLLRGVATELSRLGPASTNGYQHGLIDPSGTHAGGWKFVADDHVDHMQLVEVLGDEEVDDSWIVLPVHVIDNGLTQRHLDLTMDLQMAVELFDALHSLIHMKVSRQALDLKREVPRA
jgi:hypothetical protein